MICIPEEHFRHIPQTKQILFTLAIYKQFALHYILAVRLHSWYALWVCFSVVVIAFIVVHVVIIVVVGVYTFFYSVILILLSLFAANPIRILLRYLFHLDCSKKKINVTSTWQSRRWSWIFTAKTSLIFLLWKM